MAPRAAEVGKLVDPPGDRPLPREDLVLPVSQETGRGLAQEVRPPDVAAAVLDQLGEDFAVSQMLVDEGTNLGSHFLRSPAAFHVAAGLDVEHAGAPVPGDSAAAVNCLQKPLHSLFLVLQAIEVGRFVGGLDLPGRLGNLQVDALSRFQAEEVESAGRNKVHAGAFTPGGD